ncbi:hypothetical protein [Methylobacterium sp. E-046]|uniref:hypothetical protein n=1 Tax=Methylobacterium sp. E-046 TaxID=2836576 RepID=UPI001FB9B4F6|nr:hypothetical protein [Methylobacterium sp. E-046]MCJ2101943.1 hypothetical protein [Methylobacterium sp. E-046]
MASLFGLGVVLISAWLLSEHVNDLNNQIVRQDSVEAKKVDEFKSALRDAVTAKDSAIADRDRVAKSYGELQVELRSEIARMTAEKDKALRLAAELQTKLTAKAATKSDAGDPTSSNASVEFYANRNKQITLSKNLEDLQERYGILDARLTVKDEELSKLRSDLKISDSIAVDLSRIEELKRALMVLPSSIDIKIPLTPNSAPIRNERGKPVTQETVRTAPVVRLRPPPVIAPMHKPAVKVADKAVPTFVRHMRTEVKRQSGFGIPSGLPSELRPIGY